VAADGVTTAKDTAAEKGLVAAVVAALLVLSSCCGVAEGVTPERRGHRSSPRVVATDEREEPGEQRRDVPPDGDAERFAAAGRRGCRRPGIARRSRTRQLSALGSALDPDPQARAAGRKRLLAALAAEAPANGPPRS
jgi:hypothetical protein